MTYNEVHNNQPISNWQKGFNRILLLHLTLAVLCRGSFLSNTRGYKPIVTNPFWKKVIIDDSANDLLLCYLALLNQFVVLVAVPETRVPVVPLLLGYRALLLLLLPR